MAVFLHETKLSAFLAYKSIARGNKSTALLTIIIMALVFINTLTVSSLFNGVELLFNRQIVDTTLGHIMIEPKEGESFLQSPDVIRHKLESLPGVVASSARYATGAQIEKNGKKGTWSVFFVDPEEDARVYVFEDYMIEGEYLDKKDSGEIVLGNEITGGHGAIKEIYSLGGVKAGETVHLTFNNGFEKDYVVKGIFKTSFIIGDEFAFLSKEDMKEVMGYSDRATSVHIRLSGFGLEEEYSKKIRALNTGGEVRTWQEGAGIIRVVSETWVIINTMVSTIAFFIAAITLLIVVYISVVSRKRQIGVLKAIGVTESVIIRGFVFQALFYAFMGISLGTLLMYQVIIPHFEANPLALPIGKSSLVIDNAVVFQRAVVLFMVAAASGFIPSFKTVRENMLDLIWGKN